MVVALIRNSNNQKPLLTMKWLLLIKKLVFTIIIWTYYYHLLRTNYDSRNCSLHICYLFVICKLVQTNQAHSPLLQTIFQIQNYWLSSLPIIILCFSLYTGANYPIMTISTFFLKDTGIVSERSGLCSSWIGFTGFSRHDFNN